MLSVMGCSSFWLALVLTSHPNRVLKRQPMSVWSTYPYGVSLRIYAVRPWLLIITYAKTFQVVWRIGAFPQPMTFLQPFIIFLHFQCILNDGVDETIRTGAWYNNQTNQTFVLSLKYLLLWEYFSSYHLHRRRKGARGGGFLLRNVPMIALTD